MPVVVVVVEEDEEAIEAAVVGVAVGMEVVEIGTMTVCRLSISCLLCHHYKHCLSDQGLDLDDFHVKGLCISKIHLTNYIIKLGVPQAITNGGDIFPTFFQHFLSITIGPPSSKFWKKVKNNYKISEN